MSDNALDEMVIDRLIEEVHRLRGVERAARAVARREAKLVGVMLDLELRMNCAVLRSALLEIDLDKETRS